MAAYREWIQYTNSRGYDVMYCKGQHLSIAELTEDPSVDQYYLGKHIPSYPDTTFHVSEVCHVTGKSGLWGIFRDGGFQKYQQLDDNFLWWSLLMTKDNVADAEQSFLEELFPDGQGHNQQPFLEKFTTSPAFRSESRYGNFRFTFPLKTVLRLYTRQFCRRSSLVLRVYGTEVYQKEILYTILAHPSDVQLYNEYRRLPRGDDDRYVCGYSDGNMSWRCQAPSDSLRHRLEVDREGCTVRSLKSEVYYVWDHVAIAFHMEPNWVLRVDPEQLDHSVSVCEVPEFNLLREPDTRLSLSEAQAELKNLRKKVGLARCYD